MSRAIPQTKGELLIEAAYLVIIANMIREHSRVCAELRREVLRARRKPYPRRSKRGHI